MQSADGRDAWPSSPARSVAGRPASTGPTTSCWPRFRGRPVVVWAVSAALGAGLDETFVVERRGRLAPALGRCRAGRPGHLVVRNDAGPRARPRRWPAGIAAAGAGGHDAVVVGLADQPLVAAEAWRRWPPRLGPTPIAVATYDGRRRNPVRLRPRGLAAAAHRGRRGGPGADARRPDLVVEVACPGDPADIDTLEDLRRWS